MNEAAERHALTDGERLASCICGDWHTVSFWLAVERRATVERIRERFGMPHTEQHGWDSGPLCQYCPGPGYDAILDEEAAR